MGSLMDVILRVLGGLVPPDSADQRQQYRYQLRLGITLSAVVLGLTALTVNAFGWVPALSEGFAHTTDVKSLVVEIRQNRAQTIDNQLLELRIKHCKATTDESKQLYWAKIAPLMGEYQQITGRPYQLPACADL
jgi:hypothetical protein